MCVFVNYDHSIARRKLIMNRNGSVSNAFIRKPVNRLVSTAIIISSSLVSPVAVCPNFFQMEQYINLTNSTILN